MYEQKNPESLTMQIMWWINHHTLPANMKEKVYITDIDDHFFCQKTDESWT